MKQQNLIGSELKKVQVDDIFNIKNKYFLLFQKGLIMKIDIIPGRILGIFWTTASWVSSNNCIQITNKERKLLEEVKKFLDIHNFKYTIYHSKKEQKRDNYEYDYYRMKIYSDYIVDLLRNKYNWTGSKEHKRYYPTIDNKYQEIGFLKYYIKDQGTFDYRNTKWGEKKRYRIYGNWNYIDYLNSRISNILGVNENKPQKHNNSNLMMILYYQSKKDVNTILNFIEKGE